MWDNLSFALMYFRMSPKVEMGLSGDFTLRLALEHEHLFSRRHWNDYQGVRRFQRV